MPNNGFEGMRFLGYPVFEGLVLWDLSRADRPATLRPGLAESWAQDPADNEDLDLPAPPGRQIPRRHGLQRRRGDLEPRPLLQERQPAIRAAGSGIRPRPYPIMAGYRKIDDMTVAISTTAGQLLPLHGGLHPDHLARIVREGGPRLGQGRGLAGRRHRAVQDHQGGAAWSAELARGGYWDKGRNPKLDRILLLPMPEANTRLAALRSGQVDWIEVPPPDAIPSLKQAGFSVATNSYPHVWPWFYKIGATNSPFKDVASARG